MMLAINTHEGFESALVDADKSTCNSPVSLVILLQRANRLARLFFYYRHDDSIACPPFGDGDGLGRTVIHGKKINIKLICVWVCA